VSAAAVLAAMVAFVVALLVDRFGAGSSLVGIGVGFALCCGITDAVERRVYLPVAGVGLAVVLTDAYVSSSLKQSVVGMLVLGAASLALLVATRGRAWGFGDVLLAAVIGASFGVADGAWVFGYGFIIGFALAVVALLAKRIERKTPLPMASFVAVGSLAQVLFAHAKVVL
jgi:prepilin signal peptidase PulO-like enzyme (type II secretory pathway)